jgi:hypothetical protein
MDIEDSRVVVRFQRLITEMLVEKRLGHRRPELTDELYETWREVEQRGLKETAEYRNVLSRADRHALWLAGLVCLAAGPVSSLETEHSYPFKPDSRLGTGDPEVHCDLHLVAVGGQRPGATRVDDNITDYGMLPKKPLNKSPNLSSALASLRE